VPEDSAHVTCLARGRRRFQAADQRRWCAAASDEAREREDRTPDRGGLARATGTRRLRAGATSRPAGQDRTPPARSADRSRSPPGAPRSSSSGGYFLGRARASERLLSRGQNPRIEVSANPAPLTRLSSFLGVAAPGRGGASAGADSRGMKPRRRLGPGWAARRF
jgi:hypothetical protein